jgi:hypothetical protein
MKNNLWLLIFWLLIALALSVGGAVMSSCLAQKEIDRETECDSKDDTCIQCFHSCKKLNGEKLHSVYEERSFADDNIGCWCLLDGESKKIW